MNLSPSKTSFLMMMGMIRESRRFASETTVRVWRRGDTTSSLDLDSQDDSCDVWVSLECLVNIEYEVDDFEDEVDD